MEPDLGIHFSPALYFWFIRLKRTWGHSMVDFGRHGSDVQWLISLVIGGNSGGGRERRQALL